MFPCETRRKGHYLSVTVTAFYLPQAADVLLTTPQRQNWLQQISSRVVALPDNQYRALCLSPLQTLAERLQCVPASKPGNMPAKGIAGFNAEYDSLVYADVPERDAAPRLPSEEQSRQFSAWNVCVFIPDCFTGYR